jgi:hypothetical protein
LLYSFLQTSQIPAECSSIGEEQNGVEKAVPQPQGKIHLARNANPFWNGFSSHNPFRMGKHGGMGKQDVRVVNGRIFSDTVRHAQALFA